MRLGKAHFESRIKGDLGIQFTTEKLTSYAGLELLRRFLRTIGFFALLRASSSKLKLGGDFSFGKTVLTVVGMLLIGAKRLRHLDFLKNDPLFLRFVGLSNAPTPRTLGRSLASISWQKWPEIDRLSASVVSHATKSMGLRRWTIDIDGSVLTTGMSVERAERGFNPHHRKNPSYYPILATLAQTGHVIGHCNRRGNVHDSHRCDEFLRKTIRTARKELGMRGLIETRADGAFFRRDFLSACNHHGVDYAIKVPMWPWLNLRGVVKEKRQRDWKWLDRKAGLQGVFAVLKISAWNREERIAIYRKRVNHESSKSRQLDLFNPDDGNWEYSVVATNKKLGLKALWHFHNGRGAQEKTIGELKSGFAFGAIPTRKYSANTAWQKLNVLTHNLATTFQISTTAVRKPKSLKQTAMFLLRSVNTLRFEWLNRAARLVRPGGAPIMRLADNRAVRTIFESVASALDQAA